MSAACQQPTELTCHGPLQTQSVGWLLSTVVHKGRAMTSTLGHQVIPVLAHPAQHACWDLFALKTVGKRQTLRLPGISYIGLALAFPQKGWKHWKQTLNSRAKILTHHPSGQADGQRPHYSWVGYPPPSRFSLSAVGATEEKSWCICWPSAEQKGKAASVCNWAAEAWLPLSKGWPGVPQLSGQLKSLWEERFQGADELFSSFLPVFLVPHMRPASCGMHCTEYRFILVSDTSLNFFHHLYPAPFKLSICVL